jgi:hypothetical protein
VITRSAAGERFAPLRHLSDGTALLSTAGDLAVGLHADGSVAGWQLMAGRRARHTTLVGDAGSGKTQLLRSILRAARAAGVEASIVDVHQNTLTGLGFPTATTLDAARRVLADQYELALYRQATGGGPLQLLVIENLAHLVQDPVIANFIGPLVKETGPAQIALLAGTQQLDRWLFGQRTPKPDTLRLLTEELVLLRTNGAYLRSVPMIAADGGELEHIPSHFADETTTAGIGYLPRQCATPFRAWHA